MASYFTVKGKKVVVEEQIESSPSELLKLRKPLTATEELAVQEGKGILIDDVISRLKTDLAPIAKNIELGLVKTLPAEKISDACGGFSYVKITYINGKNGSLPLYSFQPYQDNIPSVLPMNTFYKLAIDFIDNWEKIHKNYKPRPWWKFWQKVGG